MISSNAHINTHTHKHARAQIYKTTNLRTFAHTHIHTEKVVSMKATGLNEVFFAIIVLGLNGYFIGSANANDGTYIYIYVFYDFCVM